MKDSLMFATEGEYQSACSRFVDEAIAMLHYAASLRRLGYEDGRIRELLRRRAEGQRFLAQAMTAYETRLGLAGADSWSDAAGSERLVAFYLDLGINHEDVAHAVGGRTAHRPMVLRALRKRATLIQRFDHRLAGDFAQPGRHGFVPGDAWI